MCIIIFKTTVSVAPDTAQTAGTKGSEATTTKGPTTTQHPAVCTTGTLKSIQVPSAPSSSSSYDGTPILVPDDDGHDSYTPWITIDNASPGIEITVASLQAIPEQNKDLSHLTSNFREGRRFHFLSSDISITERVIDRASTM